MDLEEAFMALEGPVAVVTMKVGDKLNGLTASWVCRVSDNPPLLPVSVGKTRYSLDLIRKSKAFCVNVLSESQNEFMQKFGCSSGADVDKFKGVKYRIGRTGSPIIEDVKAYLDCEVIDEKEAGDHIIFVGKVIDSYSG